MQKSPFPLLLALLLTGAWAINAYAQILPKSSGSSTSGTPPNTEQKILLSAVDSALFLIRVEYVLRETKGKDEKKREFGRDGKKYFGRFNGAAVLSGKRIWFDERLTRPWATIDSANYSLVKEEYGTDDYLPTISHIWISRAGSKKFVEYKAEEMVDDDAEAKDDKGKSKKKNKDEEKEQVDESGLPVIREGALAALPYKSATAGLYTSPKGEDRDTSAAFVVLLNADPREAERDTMPFSLSAPNSKLSYDAKGKAIHKLPLVSLLKTKPLGGAYFTLHVTAGRIDVRFAGVFGTRKSTEFELLPMNASIVPSPVAPAKPMVTPVPGGKGLKSDKKPDKKKEEKNNGRGE